MASQFSELSLTDSRSNGDKKFFLRLTPGKACPRTWKQVLIGNAKKCVRLRIFGKFIIFNAFCKNAQRYDVISDPLSRNLLEFFCQNP